MATASQAYSLIPTSTFASGYSAPTDGSNSSDEAESISDILSSRGSPPLIVAFIAIGLFIIALIAVFTWRRITQSRRPYIQPVRTNPQPESTLAERPVLWDVWSDLHVRDKSTPGATRWEMMTPVAAIMTLSLPLVGLPLAHPPIRSRGPGGGRVLLRMLRCWVSTIKQFHLSAPPPPPPPPLTECDKEIGPPPPRTSDEMEWDDASSLQVSVVITMPTQRRCSSGDSSEGTTLGEFCIGTMDVSWSE